MIRPQVCIARKLGVKIALDVTRYTFDLLGLRRLMGRAVGANRRDPLAAGLKNHRDFAEKSIRKFLRSKLLTSTVVAGNPVEMESVS